MFEKIDVNGKNSHSIYKYLTDLIKVKHKNLITWLKGLPYYYETEEQIFVHDGIDEDAGEYWKNTSDNEVFIWKHPPTRGKFYKDIVAGHTHTSEIAEDENYHKVFRMGEIIFILMVGQFLAKI